MNRDAGDSGVSADRAGTEPSLSEIRAEIESVDARVIELVARRTYMAQAVTRTKDENDITTTARQREQRVLAQAAETAERFDLGRESVRELFRILIAMHKDTQREYR